MRTGLNRPFIHFLLAGALLAGLRGALEASGPVAGRLPAADGERLRIEIDAARVAELEDEFANAAGRRPGKDELAGLVERAVDEELLYREALARGLDVGDGGVDARLVQKMLFLEEDAALSQPADAAALIGRARALGLDRDDLVIRRILAEKLRLQATSIAAVDAPDEASLRRAYAERGEALRNPERRSIVQLFFSRDRRGVPMERAAEEARRRLAGEMRGHAADELAPPVPLGDPFPIGQRLSGRTRDELDRLFGAGLAAAVFALAQGVWSEPIESAYGLHLVRVEAIEAAEIPSFESVRARLRLEREDALRARRLAALLAELRTRYEVAVAWPGEETR